MYNKWLRQLPTYSMVPWDKWDYSCLNESPVIHRQSNIDHLLYSRLIITADTETSKGENTDHNHIVVWSVSVAYKDTKIVTLYGRKPSDLSRCLQKLKDSIPCNRMYIFWHNLAYDWVFIRKYILKYMDEPEYQLNIKPHYPLLIEFTNGIIFRDSLAIGQRRLGKWAEDLKCEHAKTDEWDYKAVRHQNTKLTAEELHYIEMDTLVLTECINKTMDLLKCTIVTLPYTATGIPRRDIKKIGKKHKAKVKYNNCLMTYDDYIMAERTYHGGYSHANRFYIGQLMKGNIACYDFSSSYPAVLIQEKYPIEKFSPIDEISAAEILELSDKYAFMFNIELVMPALKQAEPMPALQLSKAEKVINPVLDNGRVLNAAYISVPVTEQDLAVIVEQYDFMDIKIKDCRVAVKDYLPRWLTDYIYELYRDKCTLKTGDPVIYDIQKAKLNSIYGMHVQKCIRYDIVEDYKTGEFDTDEDKEPEELYRKYVKKWGVILPYQWGVWCTAYAFRRLFELGKCAGTWLYSDTDSCYGTDWDMQAVEEYNTLTKDKLLKRGYNPILLNGKEYVLGSAALDGEYIEFITQGAKRYACRKPDGNIKITVAGVPKKTGAACLEDDLQKFQPGLIFDGKTTGKLQHTYIFIEKPYINEYGDEVGDSIDLNECDYLLDTAQIDNWDDLFTIEQEGLPIYG